MFKIVTTMDELSRAYAVRSIVFLEEQKCSYALEFDEYEHSAVHILGEEHGEPFAVGRIRYLASYAKLERIALRQAWRGRGLGHQLVEFMLAVAQAHGFTHYKMHAQAHLTRFYQQHGFVVQGDIFEEANIPHYLMIRQDKS